MRNHPPYKSVYSLITGWQNKTQIAPRVSLAWLHSQLDRKLPNRKDCKLQPDVAISTKRGSRATVQPGLLANPLESLDAEPVSAEWAAGHPEPSSPIVIPVFLLGWTCPWMAPLLSPGTSSSQSLETSGKPRSCPCQRAFVSPWLGCLQNDILYLAGSWWEVMSHKNSIFQISSLHSLSGLSSQGK